MTSMTPMTSLARALVLLVSVVALLAGALTVPSAAAAVGSSPPDHRYASFSPRPSDPAVLRSAWRRWQRLGARSYVLLVDISCFCPDRPAIETRVRRGKVVSVTHQGRSRQLRRKGYDMDRMYLILREAYADAHRVSARYDPRGVPTSVYVDRELMVADEELGYTVRLRSVRG